MKKEEKNSLVFFAEWVFYDEKDSMDKAMAYQYLKMWKKYLLRKLKNELHDYEPYAGEIVDGDKMKSDPEGWYEQWVETPALFYGPLSKDATLALKFCMKKKLPYQIN